MSLIGDTSEEHSSTVISLPPSYQLYVVARLLVGNTAVMVKDPVEASTVLTLNNAFVKGFVVVDEDVVLVVVGVVVVEVVVEGVVVVVGVVLVLVVVLVVVLGVVVVLVLVVVATDPLPPK